MTHELYEKHCWALVDLDAMQSNLAPVSYTHLPAGEGKTTTSVGLADALNAMGKKTMLCLREPSLGPVFGVKGGAAGGGYAQVVPMEDINMHFTEMCIRDRRCHF